MIKKPIFYMFLTLMLVTNSTYSGTGFEVEKATVNASGQKISGNNIEIKGSIGQAEASTTLTGSNFGINGGIWSQNYNNDIIFKNGFE